MSRPSGMDRVRAEIEQGRLWKARDRLHGLFQADPSNQEILEELGEVCFRMGDLPQAGRYWYLTERSGEDVATAARAFEERFGRNPETAVQVLPVRATIGEYPNTVQVRLRELVGSLPRPIAGPLSSGTHTKWTDESAHKRSSRFLDNLRVISILLVTVGVWIVGVIALFDYFL